MTERICYLGDDEQTGAAGYLSGILNHYGLAYDHVPSAERPGEDFLDRPYAAYILSDYPSANFPEGVLEGVVERVSRGAGLVMLGGWESFHGRLGEYHESPLARALPVVMGQTDDRRNCSQPCLINKIADHPVVEGLPFDSPPGIGGFNAFEPKAEASTILRSVEHRVERRPDGAFAFDRGTESPLLVVGAHSQGRTAALATDVAPHWVGGFVDWGDERLTAAVGEGFIEVGNWYARFFRNLVVWAGRL